MEGSSCYVFCIFHFILKKETFVKVWGEKTFCFIHFQYSIISHVYRQNLKELLWHLGNLFYLSSNFPRWRSRRQGCLLSTQFHLPNNLFNAWVKGVLPASERSPLSRSVPFLGLSLVWPNHFLTILHTVFPLKNGKITPNIPTEMTNRV